MSSTPVFSIVKLTHWSWQQKQPKYIYIKLGSLYSAGKSLAHINIAPKGGNVYP